MALPKKKSRTIVVDGIKYCWLVGPNDGYNVFVAQKEGIHGRIIEVYFDTDVNSFWVEFPNVDNLNLKIIKPKDSESIIRQAIQLGWNPDEKGTPIVYDLIDNKLLGRNKK
jgi:hypothetical protein